MTRGEKIQLIIKSKELVVTKERVLAAAEKCKDAKAVLRELFPEAFQPEWISVPNVYERSDEIFPRDHPLSLVVQIRHPDSVERDALYVPSHYEACLIPSNIGGTLIRFRKKGN